MPPFAGSVHLLQVCHRIARERPLAALHRQELTSTLERFARMLSADRTSSTLCKTRRSQTRHPLPRCMHGDIQGKRVRWTCRARRVVNSPLSTLVNAHTLPGRCHEGRPQRRSDSARQNCLWPRRFRSRKVLHRLQFPPIVLLWVMACQIVLVQRVLIGVEDGGHRLPCVTPRLHAFSQIWRKD